MDPIELNAPRQEESKYIGNLGMNEGVPEEESWAEAGEPQMCAGWVDVIKNSKGEKLIRSRLVASGGCAENRCWRCLSGRI